MAPHAWLIGALQSAESPLGAEKVNAVLDIKNGRVEIQSLKGESGGGTFSAQGFAVYQPAAQFNLTLAAKNVRLRYPEGTRSILDGDLILTGSGRDSLLNGRVVVDRLSLTNGFDLSRFADQFTGSTSTSLGPSFAQNVKLNVSVKTASEMALASGQLGGSEFGRSDGARHGRRARSPRP